MEILSLFIAWGENSKARGLVVLDKSEVKMGTDNHSHVEEACEWELSYIIDISWRVVPLERQICTRGNLYHVKNDYEKARIGIKHHFP